MMKPTLKALVIACAALMLPAPAIAQDSNPTRESLVKSAMVYNFIRFIEWPEDEESDRQVCSYSGSVYAMALASIEGKPVGDAQVKTKVLGDADSLADCDVIVLSQSDEPRFYTQEISMDAGNILTIGESQNFARQGGVIGFTERDGRIGFEVNVDQAEAQRLNFSSRLLRLATIVSGGGEQ